MKRNPADSISANMYCIYISSHIETCYRIFRFLSIYIQPSIWLNRSKPYESFRVFTSNPINSFHLEKKHIAFEKRISPAYGYEIPYQSFLTGRCH